MKLEAGMYCYEKNNRKVGIGKISAFEKHQNVVIVYKKSYSSSDDWKCRSKL